MSAQPIDVSEAISTVGPHENKFKLAQTPSALDQVYLHHFILEQDKEIQKRRDSLMLIKSKQSDVESRACMTEVEAEHALADLESKVKLYNSAARKLQLIPHTAKYANATRFEAEINPRAQTEEAMV